MGKKKKGLAQSNYKKLIDSIGMLLQEGRRNVYQQVNSILVKTYWEIGIN